MKVEEESGDHFVYEINLDQEDWNKDYRKMIIKNKTIDLNVVRVNDSMVYLQGLSNGIFYVGGIFLIR